MPTYTFLCPKCKHKLTDIFPMKDFDGKKLVCPKCGQKSLKRVYDCSFSIINKSSICPTGTCPLTGK